MTMLWQLLMEIRITFLSNYVMAAELIVALYVKPA
jgi:hypothetical protein